ncbi:hypothetical protein D5045_09835 [Verminephrobacter eiseniae]|nr:hypothetical protein [Verminephrobacter eiseniae]
MRLEWLRRALAVRGCCVMCAAVSACGGGGGRWRMGRWLADTASDHRACAPAAAGTRADTDRMMSESIQSGFTGAPYPLPFFAVTCPPVTTKAPMPTP